MSAPTSYECTEPAELVDMLLCWGPLKVSDRNRVDELMRLMTVNVALPPIVLFGDWAACGLPKTVITASPQAVHSALVTVQRS